jgi:hypothetical protein
MWDVIICFEDSSSDRIADAKIGSMDMALAIWTGRDGPFSSRNFIMFCFFSCTSIMISLDWGWL